jgi:hypothetical protein
MLVKTSVPVRNPEIIAKLAEDEAVLVMPHKGQVKVVNEVGAVIWELIDGKRTIELIIEEIVSQFDVDPVTAESDVINFTTELYKREIIDFSS